MRPFYKYEIDWDNSGSFDGGSEDVTAYVIGPCSWSRGASADTQLLRRSEPGTASIVVRNVSGRFSPFNAAGPLYGSLLPGRLLRISCGVASADTVRFTGRIATIEPQRGEEPIAVITAVGLLQDLQNRKIITPWFAGELTGTIAEKILDYAGIGYQGVVATDSPLAHYRMDQVVVSALGNTFTPEVLGKGLPQNDVQGAPFGSPTSTILPQTGALALDSDGALSMDRTANDVMVAYWFKSLIYYAVNPWTVECWVSTTDFAASPTKRYIWSTGDPSLRGGEGVFCWVDTSGGVRRINVQRVSNAGGTTVTATVTSNTFVKSGSFMHLVVTFDGATITVYIDGVSRATAADTTPFVVKTQAFFLAIVNTWFQLQFGALEANGVSGNLSMTLDEVAGYDHALTSTRVAAHYSMGITGARRVEAGQSTLGVWFADDGYALEELRQIEDTEMGFVYEGADGLPVFEDRSHRLTASRSLTPQMVFSDDPGDDYPYLVELVQQDPLKSIINDVKIEIPSYVPTIEDTTLTLRPNGAGASSAWSPSAGANWECVDDETPDDDSTYVTTGISVFDWYALPDDVPDGAAISQVEVFVRAKGSGSDIIQSGVRTASGLSDFGPALALTDGAYADFSRVLNLNPETGDAWTKAAIDGLQIGLKYISGTSAVVTQTYAIVSYTVPVRTLQWSLSEEPLLAPGETAVIWARMNNEGYAEDWAEINFNTTFDVGTAHSLIGFEDEAGSPYAIALISSNGQIVNPAATIAFEQYARAMKITLTNDEPTKYIRLVDWQMAALAQVAGAPKQVSAANYDSQAKYGIRSYPFPGKFVPDVQTAAGFANAITAQYGAQQPVLSVPYFANASDALFGALIGLEISDRVTGKASNILFYFGIEQDFFIEAIREEVSYEAGIVHKMFFDLSPVTTFDYWILGTSALGLDTRLAFSGGE